VPIKRDERFFLKALIGWNNLQDPTNLYILA
jgi:hypothetical protein